MMYPFAWLLPLGHVILVVYEFYCYKTKKITLYVWCVKSVLCPNKYFKFQLVTGILANFILLLIVVLGFGKTPETWSPIYGGVYIIVFLASYILRGIIPNKLGYSLNKR